MSINLHIQKYSQPTADDKEGIIYLGGDPRDVPQEIRENTQVLAYTHTLSRNPENTWAKGYIYFRNMPNDPDSGENYYAPELKRFNAIILHELGHTLGNEHLTNTITDPKILYYLGAMDENTQWSLEDRENITHHTSFSRDSDLPTVVNRDGANTTTLRFKNSQQYHSQDIEISIKRGESLRTFQFMTMNNVLETGYLNFTQKRRAFNIAKYTHKGDPDERFEYDFLEVEQKSCNGIIIVDGVIYPATYYKNILGGTKFDSHGSAYRIYFLKDGKWQNLLTLNP